MDTRKLILIAFFLGLAAILPTTVNNWFDYPTHIPYWFSYYNQLYFNDELPHDVKFSFDLTGDEVMAQTVFLRNGRIKINFNLKYNVTEKQAVEKLLHENCHIENFIKHEEDPNDAHGVAWERCMHRLASQGALDNIW
jgi:hypothetical protein